MIKPWKTLLAITLISNIAVADCVSDCLKIIDAANKTIEARDQVIKTQEDTIATLISNLSSANATIDRSNEQLNSWYRNPFIAIGLGFIVGGVTVLYLKK